jgi:hypothetical protein
VVDGGYVVESVKQTGDGKVKRYQNKTPIAFILSPANGNTNGGGDGSNTNPTNPTNGGDGGNSGGGGNGGGNNGGGGNGGSNDDGMGQD